MQYCNIRESSAWVKKQASPALGQGENKERNAHTSHFQTVFAGVDPSGPWGRNKGKVTQEYEGLPCPVLGGSTVLCHASV